MANTRSGRRGLWARSAAGWLGERALAMILLGGLLLSTYHAVSLLTRDRHVVLATSLDAAIPFIPETVWIYLPLYVFILSAGPLSIGDRSVFYRTVASMALAGGICLVGFLLVPSRMDLPPVADDGSWTSGLMRLTRWIDVPNNTFPSQHVAVTFACTFGVLRHHRRWGLVLLALSALLVASTMTTKQHYWIDSPVGLAAAGAAHYLVFRGWRGRRLSAKGG